MVLWWRVFYLRSTGSTESVPPSIKDSVLALLLCAPYQAPLQCMSALVIQVTPDLWTKVPVDPDQTFFPPRPPAILYIFTLSSTPTHGQQLHLTCHQRISKTRLEISFKNILLLNIGKLAMPTTSCPINLGSFIHCVKA